MVVVVGAALAFTSLGLKSRQQENINADKMKQILASVHITPAKDSVTTDFDRYITRSFIVNSLGDELPGNAFDVNTAEEAKKPVAERQLPVYECTVAPGDVKYIVPVNGAGLWGPIWGYVSINADGSTVYGAYFAHQGETPGLGAEIEKPAFSGQFEGKQSRTGSGQRRRLRRRNIRRHNHFKGRRLDDRQLYRSLLQVS